jgi:DNA polymerase III subunit epsilon
MQREVILDTETTGIDPSSGHRIVEIGCLELIGGARSGRFFHTYLNPEREIPAEAEAIHGLSDAFLKDKPLFSQRVDEFLEFIEDAMLVIHNAAFDLKFLNAELTRLGFPGIPGSRATDTLAMARKKFPGSPAGLDALCKRFGIDTTARTKHGALLDAELLAEVYVELLGGKQVVLALDPHAYVTNGSDEKERVTFYPARNFPITLDEVQAHEDMLVKLKKPVWES